MGVGASYSEVIYSEGQIVCDNVEVLSFDHLSVFLEIWLCRGVKVSIFELNDVVAELTSLYFVESRELSLLVSPVIEKLLDCHKFIIVVAVFHVPSIDCFVDLTKGTLSCRMQNLITAAEVWGHWCSTRLLRLGLLLVDVIWLANLLHEVLLLF